jgi:prepilin-type processing-associated H-X9-DG protein
VAAALARAIGAVGSGSKPWKAASCSRPWPSPSAVPDQGKQPGNGLIGAQSNHPGGVNVGMLDGSVRFMKDSIARPTWWAVATYSGGEVIDAASF